jgi:hypothetical protein
MQSVILAVLADPEAALRTLSAAFWLALATGQARIDALVIRTPPQATILPTEEVLTRQDAERIRAREQERVAALQAVYAAWTATLPAGGIMSAWCDVEGLAEPVIEAWGRRSDFIVLKRPADHSRLADRQRIQAALFNTDRPVLVVPPNPVATMGRCIAIAWRDDKRTIRAVLSALRCLGLAQSVHVLAGVREGAPPARLPDILDEHAVAATLHAMPIGAGVFGAALIEQAHALGADMLVMGAYVHSPVRSFVLGGVTRYMLSHGDLPMLMRH